VRLAGGIVARIHAQIDGVKYEPGPIKASEGETIAGWTGYSVKEWELHLVLESDPLAARALVGLTRLREGEKPRFAALEVDDVDSIEAEFRDDSGRLVEFVRGEDGLPTVKNGQLVVLVDGEPVDPPTAAPQTD
jgi:hypothetical protein